MAGIPVVIKPSGGLPVTVSTRGAPMEIATNGFGIAVTQATNGLPVSGITFGPTLQLTGNSVAENAAVNTTVGTLSVTSGTTGTPAYTLTDSAGGKFNLSGSTLRTNAALDYETATSHNVTVSVSGLTPAVSAATFTIIVTNVDDTAPLITSTNTVSNVENTVLAHTLTANETVTWAIVGGADAARFELSGSTLRWASNGTKDFEAPDDADTNNTYVVQVRATDLVALPSATQTITVTVTDVFEAPTAPVNTVAPVLSGTPTQGQVLSCTTGTWTGTATITYARQWYQALDDGSGGILTDGSGNPLGDAIIGATASSYTLVAGDVDSFIFCIVTATNGVGSATAYSNVTATPVAATGGWSPLDLPGLVSWWKADTGVVTVSGNIASVDDQSSSGATLTNVLGSIPFNATGFNGHPAFDFIPASGGILQTGVAAVPMGTGTTGSFFIVGQMRTGTANNGRLIGYVANGQSADFNNDGSAAVILRNGTGNSLWTYRNGVLADTSISLATNYRLGVIFNGTNATQYVNNSAGSSGACSLAWGATGRIGVGNQIGAATSWDGPVAEVVVTNTALDATNRGLLDVYFVAKYGL
jgi:hypothetical protein